MEGCRVGEIERIAFGSDARMPHKAFGDVLDPPSRSWPDAAVFLSDCFESGFRFPIANLQLTRV